MPGERAPVGNDEYLGMLRRCILAGGRRVAEGDVWALQELVALHETVEQAIDLAVGGLRHDYSWAEIARPLKITRQAAFQRWGRTERKRA